MSIILPPRTTFYDISDKQENGFYAIEGACNNVHKFNIPKNEYIKINIVNTEPNTQDMSMRGWFSDSIMGQMLFSQVDGRLIPFNVPKMYSYDNTNIPTPGLLLYIYDSNNKDFNDENLRLSSDNDYYICIQNIQNKKNSYRLLFSTDNYETVYNDQTKNGSGFTCDEEITDPCVIYYEKNNNPTCSCNCHTKSKGRPRKTKCDICGCLPNTFIR